MPRHKFARKFNFSQRRSSQSPIQSSLPLFFRPSFSLPKGKPKATTYPSISLHNIFHLFSFCRGEIRCLEEATANRQLNSTAQKTTQKILTSYRGYVFAHTKVADQQKTLENWWVTKWCVRKHTPCALYKKIRPVASTSSKGSKHT